MTSHFLALQLPPTCSFVDREERARLEEEEEEEEEEGGLPVRLLSDMVDPREKVAQ